MEHAGMQGSATTGRRLMSGLSGFLILLAALFETYNLVEGAYYDYFFFPRVKKEEYIIPARWQDIVARIVLWGGTILLLYIAYRLLKYAFRRGAPRPEAKGY
jgi:hypothetical protein